MLKLRQVQNRYIIDASSAQKFDEGSIAQLEDDQKTINHHFENVARSLRDLRDRNTNGMISTTWNELSIFIEELLK